MPFPSDTYGLFVFVSMSFNAVFLWFFFYGSGRDILEIGTVRAQHALIGEF